MIASARRPISVTSDIIVGFPGETDQDLDETLSLLDAVRYDGVFAFQYSARPNTSAAHLPDAIPEEEKGRRLAMVLDRQRQIQIIRNDGLIGQTLEVLVDGASRRPGQWSGRSSSNRILNFASPHSDLLGKYVHVRVTSATPE